MSTAPAIKRKIVDGVDGSAPMDTIVAIKSNPETAKFNFRATNVKVAAAFEFAVTVGAAVLANQLLWLIAASAVDRLA